MHIVCVCPCKVGVFLCLRGEVRKEQRAVRLQGGPWNAGRTNLVSSPQSRLQPSSPLMSHAVVSTFDPVVWSSACSAIQKHRMGGWENRGSQGKRKMEKQRGKIHSVPKNQENQQQRESQCLLKGTIKYTFIQRLERSNSKIDWPDSSSCGMPCIVAIYDS